MPWCGSGAKAAFPLLCPFEFCAEQLFLDGSRVRLHCSGPHLCEICAKSAPAAQAKAPAARFLRGSRSSAVDEVHQPACHDDGPCEEHEAIDPVAHHGTRFAPLRDTEDGRGKEREEQYGREVGGSEDHDFLPMRMLCASTAAMTFSSPATTMNLVP